VISVKVPGAAILNYVLSHLLDNVVGTLHLLHWRLVVVDADDVDRNEDNTVVVSVMGERPKPFSNTMAARAPVLIE
jgi:hypothetical protein